jgi:hypothetical protein
LKNKTGQNQLLVVGRKETKIWNSENVRSFRAEIYFWVNGMKILKNQMDMAFWSKRHREQFMRGFSKMESDTALGPFSTAEESKTVITLKVSINMEERLGRAAFTSLMALTLQECF